MRAWHWALCAALISVAPACGPRTMAVRVRDAERLAGRIDGRLEEAQRAQQGLEPDLADRALREAKRGLEEPDLQLYPESELLKERFAELEAALPAVRAARERRDLERRLEAIRDSIVGHSHAVTEALPKLSAQAPDARAIDAVERPARQVLARLDAEREQLAKDATFSAWAKSQRARAESALEEVALARVRVSLIEGPGEAFREAVEAAERARPLKKPAERVSHLERASARAEDCAAEGAKRRLPPAVDAGVILLAGKSLTPPALFGACRDLAKQVRNELERDRAQLEREAVAAKRAADAARAREEKMARAEEAKRKKEGAARAAEAKKATKGKPPAKPGTKPAAKPATKPAPKR